MRIAIQKFASLKRLARISLTAAALASALGITPQRTAAKTHTRDLPYVTIDHPQFVAASKADFLGPKDIVLGVTDGRTAKAYPAAILAQHGVVQDKLAGVPIAVTW